MLCLSYNLLLIDNIPLAESLVYLFKLPYLLSSEYYFRLPIMFKDLQCVLFINQ